MKLVNLGCGAVYHPAWHNFDISPVGPDVHRWDIRRPLPLAEASVDAIYSSHVLEHLTGAEAGAFLAECKRLLQPNGILRIVVPDLEGIVRAYLRELECSVNGGDPSLYHWCRLEIYDQLARVFSGGEMAPYARNLSESQAARVRARAGKELDGIRRVPLSRPKLTVGKLVRRARFELAKTLARVAGGREMMRAISEGHFRQKGEVHRVMYDRYSLAELLVSAGFSGPTVCTARESAILDFERYDLDTEGDEVRKPDSLYIEARRP